MKLIRKSVKQKIIKRKPRTAKPNGEKRRWDLEKEYLEARTALTRAREQSALLILAKAREELVEREMVIKQASYLYIAMRQKLLALPTSCARRVLNKSDITEVVSILKEQVYQALREIADLPNKAVDPNWLSTLDEDETYH